MSRRVKRSTEYTLNLCSRFPQWDDYSGSLKASLRNDRMRDRRTTNTPDTLVFSAGKRRRGPRTRKLPPIAAVPCYRPLRGRRIESITKEPRLIGFPIPLSIDYTRHGPGKNRPSRLNPSITRAGHQPKQFCWKCDNDLATSKWHASIVWHAAWPELFESKRA